MTSHIMFVHGAWMTPSSWDNFRPVFETAGFTTVAPAWPYMDRPVADLNASPAAELKHLGITDIVDHYAAELAKLPEPPIIVGHSFGGLVTQLLLNRGLGVAGIAIDPAPPRGVLPAPAAFKTSWAVFSKFGGWSKIHTMSEKNFASGFANALTAGQQHAEYQAQVVPAPGRIFFQAAFGIANGLDWKRTNRAPLLLVGGGVDKTVPLSMVKSNFAKASRNKARTDIREYPDRCHFQMAQDGWEQVAQDCVAWIQSL